MEIGKKIRELRELRHWTREELAKQTTLAIDTISKLELGKTKHPNNYTIGVLEQTFGLAPNTLKELMEE